MEKLARNMRARADQLGIPDAEVARRADLSPRRYGHYVEGTREPGYETFLRICRALDTTPDQLLGVKSRNGSAAVVTANEEEYASVAVYEARASAGPGAVGSDAVKHRHMFRRQWLRTITNARVEELAVIEIDGDSMEPTLRSGDHVLVDRTQTGIRRDGIFVIVAEDAVLAKRVSYDPGTKTLTISSDNPAHRSYTIKNPATVNVLGRVIWIGRRV